MFMFKLMYHYLDLFPPFWVCWRGLDLEEASSLYDAYKAGFDIGALLFC